jgi:hypothetical protein
VILAIIISIDMQRHVWLWCIGIKYFNVRAQTGSAAKESGFDFRPRQETFSTPQPPYQFWGPPSLLSNGYREISPGIKRPVPEDDHSSPSSAEVKNTWSYIYTVPYVFMTELIKHMDNFALPFLWYWMFLRTGNSCYSLLFGDTVYICRLFYDVASMWTP